MTRAMSRPTTSRINGYKIMEETLNLKDVRIFDYVEDENGKRTPVLNKKETAIAQGKQELIKQAFADWIWEDPERREELTKLYNEKFNSIRPREYDGSHMSFAGINPGITLRPHQVNATRHILYGGNTLLAHVVGAGNLLAGGGPPPLSAFADISPAIGGISFDSYLYQLVERKPGASAKSRPQPI